jgi:hypothetical protein
MMTTDKILMGLASFGAWLLIVIGLDLKRKWKYYWGILLVYAIIACAIAAIRGYGGSVLLIFIGTGMCASIVISIEFWDKGWVYRYAPIVYTPGCGYLALPSDDNLLNVSGFILVGAGFWLVAWCNVWDLKRKGQWPLSVEDQPRLW